MIANWDSTITSSMLNNIRFQWAVDNEIAGANAAGPSVHIASVMQYGMPNALPRPAFPDEHRIQIADTLSWSHGKHQIKAGFDINRIHEVLVNLFQGGGIYSYSGAPQTAFNNWVVDAFGINIGDGLTGKHYTAPFTQVTDPITGVGKDDFYDNDFAGFVEDSWKVRPNLTVNLGVRYEIQMIPQPPKPNTSTPLNAYLTSKINTDSNNFGPRIGIAWEPMKGTVVRLGYGMFYGEDHKQHLLYDPRRERHLSADVQLQPDFHRDELLSVADVPQSDLHSAGSDAGCAVRRGADPAGDHRSPLRRRDSFRAD